MWLSLLFPKRSPNRGSKSWADRRPTTRFRPRMQGLEDRDLVQGAQGKVLVPGCVGGRR